jgi:hypothetical protein
MQRLHKYMLIYHDWVIELQDARRKTQGTDGDATLTLFI